MTSTTEVEAKGQCAHCKRVLPVSQLITLYPGGVYCADTADCGQNGGQRERHAEAAHEAAEPVQETPADQDAETGPAEAPAAAEDAPEAVTDLGGNT